MSALEEKFALQCRAMKLEPVREYRLFAEIVGAGKGLRQRLKDAELKDYRFDFAFPDIKLAVEIQGGTWMKRGAHNSGIGLNRDFDKLNKAQLQGWDVLLFSGDTIRNGEAIATAKRMIERLQE